MIRDVTSDNWRVTADVSNGRYKAENSRFQLKQKRKREELKAVSDAGIKELEQLHNEKCECLGATRLC